MVNSILQTESLLSIDTIAEKLGLAPEEYERVGRFGAKLNLNLLDDARLSRQGKLILVTATTPTTSGEGKTVVSIGLAQGLERIGLKSVVTSREPSLGPVFGMKGGAAGGGQSQVEPSRQINLHFHGDFHAITAAHNLLAAMIDSHLFFGNKLNLDPAEIQWPRAMDMNDRALRYAVVSAGEPDKPGHEGANRATGFVITAASEIMAILGLSTSRADLRRRLESIVIGVSRAGQPVTAKDLGATGAMMALLNEALMPNLVQTTEGTPALVHTGPFANIAHGTSSVVSQKMAVRLADYVVNECGFAADLGAEKYFDIVMGKSGIKPAVAVLVATVQSLKAQGVGDLGAGFANLRHHTSVLKEYGVPVVVAINRFPADTQDELAAIQLECARLGIDSAVTASLQPGWRRLNGFGEEGSCCDRKESGAQRAADVCGAGRARRENTESRNQGLRRISRNFQRRSKDEARALRRLGLRAVAGVHRQDAILTDRRSKAHGCSARLDVAHQRRVAFGGRGFCGRCCGQYDAHAWIAARAQSLGHRCG